MATELQSPSNSLPENGLRSPEIHVNNEPFSFSPERIRLSPSRTQPRHEYDNVSVCSDRTVEADFENVPLNVDFPDNDIWEEDAEHMESKKHNVRDSTASMQTVEFPPFQEEDVFEDASTAEPRSRSNSSVSRRSEGSGEVDWIGLEKTERQECRDEVSDQSTAFLLARLEQENNTLATDPRFGLKGRLRHQSRPPSIHVLKRMINTAEPPPMTELEFWAALVKDYPQTAQRLPTLTSHKIKGGVPPPLRGVVWVSMVGARDADLGDQFEKLCSEHSPYESLIGKDIGRSFPGVEMFRDPEGEGQTMLGKVLRAFSLYDKEIGYCQGLGFLVGPLLMHMNDKDAFCVLVKLMENYDLRSCFLPSLAGLHVRIYQFQQLLNQHIPEVAEHLKSLGVEAAYLSQWFLSFFAVTCPLPMLFRIYDVIFAEGASETIMRVALSLMRRNQDKLMASKEFEEVMQLLLSRNLWDIYSDDADELVNDFMDMTGVVTRESLKTLEASFKAAHGSDPGAWFAFLPDATAAASRFLGRLWAVGTPIKGMNLSPYSIDGRPINFLRRTASKQSLTPSVHSDGKVEASTLFEVQRNSDGQSVDSKSASLYMTIPVLSKEDKDLHTQIEDLLTALSDMQRQHALLSADLQREREERAEDVKAAAELVQSLEPEKPVVASRPASVQFAAKDLSLDRASIAARRRTMQAFPKRKSSTVVVSQAVERVRDRINIHRSDRGRSSVMFETKQRLRDSLIRSKGQLESELSRSAVLLQKLDEQEKAAAKALEDLRLVEEQLEEEVKERERLEKELEEYQEVDRPVSLVYEDLSAPSVARNTTEERRLSLDAPPAPAEQTRPRSDSNPTVALHSRSGSTIPARSTSLATKTILATQDHIPALEDDLLVELVNAKTSEAVARQELEEVKGKLDAMRKMLGVPSPITPTSTTPINYHKASASESNTTSLNSFITPLKTSIPIDRRTPAQSAGPVSALGGFWGWGKRSASSQNIKDPATPSPPTIPEEAGKV